jgi:shikimate 5-dehydrogenase
VIHPLMAAGARRLVVANRTADRARALAARFPGAAG